MRLFRYLFVFLIAFFFVSSSVYASEVSDPTLQEEQGSETEEEVTTLPEDIPDEVPEEETEVVPVVEYDFAELNNSIIDLGSSAAAANEYNLALNYAKGVLMNKSNMSDYLFYSSTVDGVTHYYLFYDLALDDTGNVIFGTYPCIDICSVDGLLCQYFSMQPLQELPNFGWGSFGNYAALIDKQFHFNDLYAGLIVVMVMFILFRKRVFT